jgi:uncharacterized membrane protein YebE (DUF533 family)
MTSRTRLIWAPDTHQRIAPMTAARTLFIALAALTAIGATSASADETDRRQAMQERRIQDAVRSGEITRRERAGLEAEQARIRQLEARAKADGRVDHREAAEIRRAQNEASRHIKQESTDGERRGSWIRRWW